MLLRNAIHFGACLGFLRGQAQQIPDLVEREAEVPATADKMKPPPMFHTIRSVVSIRARSDGHQSDLLVIADRDNFDARFARELSNGERLRRWHLLDPIVTIACRLRLRDVQVSEICCPPPVVERGHCRAYRRVLWIALGVNLAMFIVEMIAGLSAGSVSLQADSLDFLSDTANYGISLFVAGMALRNRAIAAFGKGVTMGLFGIWVLASSVWKGFAGAPPEAVTMGVVGFAALAANAVCFALLSAYRSGDSNMRSVWLCSRNDLIGNCAVLAAAIGVARTSAVWPDVLVAAIMAVLALQGAAVVVTQARAELAGTAA
jgi:hypothetical protein